MGLSMDQSIQSNGLCDLENLLSNLENLILPSRDCLINIISQTKRILQREKNLLTLSGNFNIAGDIHGQFFDFLKMKKLFIPSNKTLFLGDYVDRGYNSVELIIYLMIWKLHKQEDIYLLRGNHENRSQTAAYGFKSECIKKYDIYIYWKICETFEYLPVAAIINNTYFCLHGGISPNLSLDWFEEIDRMQEYNEVSIILWGDPSERIDYFTESQRGAGYIFGRLATIEFLEKVKCKYLVRSHQLVFNGVEELFDRRCITIWSAPNYCYKCKNIACFMVVNNEEHVFVFFQHSDEQYRV